MISGQRQAEFITLKSNSTEWDGLESVLESRMTFRQLKSGGDPVDLGLVLRDVIVREFHPILGNIL
jgi:hypothetical protein